jgi:hypothetical protein
METTAALIGLATTLLDGAAVVGVLVGVRLAVNAANGSDPRCPECGYCLSHLPESGCPECGWQRAS